MTSAFAVLLILTFSLKTSICDGVRLAIIPTLQEYPLIAELRMDMLQRCKGEMVKMIERGMTVPSMGIQFLTIESKPGEVYWEKTVLDGGRQQELRPLS